MDEMNAKRIELVVEFEVRDDEGEPEIDDMLAEIESVVKDICPHAYNIFSEELG